MARPSDWHVVDLHSDPTPGDPWRVRDLAGRLRSLGDDAEYAARDVRGLAGDRAAMNWLGAAGDAFREEIGKFPGQLDKVAVSHHSCADALYHYADKLDGTQSQADRALIQARPLFDQVAGLRSQLMTANTANTTAKNDFNSTSGSLSTQTDARDRYTGTQAAVDRLNHQLSGPEAQLEALKKLAHQAHDLRTEAEDTAVREINDATDQGIPPDSFWHKLGDIAAAVWHGLVIAAEIVSLIGGIILLVVGGPLWLIIAVVAAGLIMLADTLYKYSQGKASLWDVGLSLLACIPITKGFTSLAELAEAFRAGGMLGAGLHLGGAILGGARDMLVGMAKLLKGGFGKIVSLFADGGKQYGAAEIFGPGGMGGGIFGDGRDAVPLWPGRFADGRPGFTLFNPREPLFVWMSKVAPDMHFPFDVGVHGSPTGVALQYGHGPADVLHFDSNQFAKLIQQSGWNGEPIRMLSCNTGQLPLGFAQEVSNILGVPVKAPSELLWVGADGSTSIHPFLNGLPIPDTFNPGHFKVFNPGFSYELLENGR